MVFEAIRPPTAQKTMSDKPEPVKRDSDPMIAATEELFAPGITQTPPKATHSPLPWNRVVENVYSGDGRCVCECYLGSPEFQDTALIVRAVNAHDALVVACELAFGCALEHSTLEDKLKSALALAKEPA